MRLAWVIVVAACASAPRPRPRVERADQLPQHSYPVPADVATLLDDDAAFARLSVALRTDLEADLAGYDIRDRATVKDHLFQLALLDALDGKLPAAVARLDRAATFADKPAEKLMLGLTIRVWADAKGGDVRAALARALDRMPYDVVAAELKKLRTIAEIVTPRFAHGVIAADVGPAAASGRISRELAEEIVFQRWVVRRLAPVSAVFDELIGARIAAHTQVKPEIWSARDITVDRGAAVAIGVWDTGVDTALFGDRVDGVLAFDLDHRRTERPLMELDNPGQLADKQAVLVGVLDLAANVESEAAAAARRYVSSLEPAALVGALDDLGLLAKYVHGTHVTSIALRGNPSAKVVVVRNTWDWHAKPRTPTRADAEAWAQQYRDAVHFFHDHHVRVVNMSWDFSAAELEAGLEANGAGGDPAQRRALARQLYEIEAQGMRDAIAGAPEILFVAASGNSNDDATFRGSAPIVLGLPNVLAVGAVDQGGDEAPFTSPGTVYANGYEVAGLFPGGATQQMSGTSMAAPQVTNLAGKLLAAVPTLTTEQLVHAIVDGATAKASGGRAIKLIDGAKSLELARGYPRTATTNLR